MTCLIGPDRPQKLWLGDALAEATVCTAAPATPVAMTAAVERIAYFRVIRSDLVRRIAVPSDGDRPGRQRNPKSAAAGAFGREHTVNLAPYVNRAQSRSTACAPEGADETDPPA